MKTIDLGQGGEMPVAPEDMQIIVAVVENLVHEKKVFRINLPHGAYLTNIEGGPVFSFSGIDQIVDGKKKLVDAGATEPFHLTMPSDQYKIRTKIGVLFNMEVFADPLCPKNEFLIQQPEEAA